MAVPKAPLAVGICIDNTPMFSNGAIQNALFMQQALEGAGFGVRFLAPDGDVHKFGLPGQERDVLPIDAAFPFHEFCVIVTVTKLVGGSFSAECKRRGIAVVKFVCGNYLVFLNEEFAVKGAREEMGSMVHNVTGTAVADVDAVWTYPGLLDQVAILETLTKKPVTVVPHTWSPCLIDAHDFPQPWPIEVPTSPASVLIYESNYSTFKSGFLPLLACERLHADDPYALRAVHLLCAPEHPKGKHILDSLALTKDGKLQRYGRMATPAMMRNLRQVTNGGPIVVVSHTMFNPLNYAHYELLSRGFALVHNSEPLKEYGYFYPGNDVAAAAAQIKRAAREHTAQVSADTALAFQQGYFQTVNPEGDRVQALMRAAVMQASMGAALKAVLRSKGSSSPNQ